MVSTRKQGKEVYLWSFTDDDKKVEIHQSFAFAAPFGLCEIGRTYALFASGTRLSCVRFDGARFQGVAHFEMSAPILSVSIDDGVVFPYVVHPHSIASYRISADPSVVSSSTSKLPLSPKSAALVARFKTKAAKTTTTKTTTTTKKKTSKKAKSGANLLVKLLSDEKKSTDATPAATLPPKMTTSPPSKRTKGSSSPSSAATTKTTTTTTSDAALAALEKRLVLQMNSAVKQGVQNLHRVMREEHKKTLKREKANQELLLRVLSDALTQKLPQYVEDAVKDEIELTLLPAIERKLNAVKIDPADLVPDVKRIVSDCVERTLIPGYERATRVMLENVKESIDGGLEKVRRRVEQLDRMDELIPRFEQALARMEESSSSSMASKKDIDASRPAPSTGLAPGQVQEMFWTALSSKDLVALLRVCEDVRRAGLDPMTVPLTQPVLLCLLQQCGTKNFGTPDEPIAQTALRLDWISVCVDRLNPRDPTIAPHCSGIVSEVGNALGSYAMYCPQSPLSGRAQTLSDVCRKGL